MNYHFRSKPVTIQAFQITQSTRESNEHWPSWLHEAWNKDRANVGACYPSEAPDSDGRDKLMVVSNSGPQLVEWGDWIVLGLDGLELYPVRDDVFQQKYEAVEEQTNG